MHAIVFVRFRTKIGSKKSDETHFVFRRFVEVNSYFSFCMPMQKGG
jgi:hypothetical protein